MENNMNCKICSGIFFSTILATSLILNNISTCEYCRKKIKENLDVKENNYSVEYFDDFRISGIHSTASVLSASNFTINNLDKY